jgi:hypothetical protein
LSKTKTIDPVKIRPTVDIEVLTSIKPETLVDSHVYVHCYFDNGNEDMLIRIWRSTFLIDKSTQTRTSLIHAENISFAPMWTIVPEGIFRFLLIFSGLPKSCKKFDLVEEIPQPGGFYVSNITRNETDVYHITI